VHVDVYGEGDGLAAALRAAFPDELFAEDDERGVEELVLEACRRRGLRLATAESCTGGLVAARLTDVPGASAVFVGGIVAYADEVKAHELGVPELVLERHGAVSAETAAAMAAGVRTRLEAEVAVAVTGIAGPGGGTREKPVGLVYIAIGSPGGDSVERFQLPGVREAVRSRATAIALHLLRRVLTRSATPAHAGPS
jgi:nicotinamide-nucleotide amidase